MTKSQDQQRKIAQLLAKAESTGNEHEAQAFTEAAERLMIKWGIDEAMLRAQQGKGNGKAGDQIVVDKVPFYGTYATAHVHLAHAVATGLGGLRGIVTHGQGSDRTYHVTGYERDVERFLMLLTSLQLQAATALKRWTATSRDYARIGSSQRTKARKSFLVAFGHEVGNRLTKLRNEEQAPAANGDNSKAVVLVDRDKQVDKAFQDRWPRTRQGRGMSVGYNGYAAGKQAGREASLGGTSLGGSRNAIAG